MFANESIEKSDDNIVITCEYHDYYYDILGCPRFEDYKESPARILFSSLNDGGWMVSLIKEVRIYGSDGNIVHKEVETDIFNLPIKETTVEKKENGVLFYNKSQQSLELFLDEYGQLEILAITNDNDDILEFGLWIEEGDISKIYIELIQKLSEPYNRKLAKMTINSQTDISNDNIIRFKNLFLSPFGADFPFWHYKVADLSKYAQKIGQVKNEHQTPSAFSISKLDIKIGDIIFNGARLTTSSDNYKNHTVEIRLGYYYNNGFYKKDLHNYRVIAERLLNIAKQCGASEIKNTNTDVYPYHITFMLDGFNFSIYANDYGYGINMNHRYET